jgi:hypothetical protein
MWEPQHLKTLWASTACYKDTFTLLYFTLLYFTLLYLYNFLLLSLLLLLLLLKLLLLLLLFIKLFSDKKAIYFNMWRDTF